MRCKLKNPTQRSPNGLKRRNECVDPAEKELSTLKGLISSTNGPSDIYWKYYRISVAARKVIQCQKNRPITSTQQVDILEVEKEPCLRERERYSRKYQLINSVTGLECIRLDDGIPKRHAYAVPNAWRF
ncbi:hypothetical protein T07_2125 [Trichinella nelsoni]|uniref:Uncharacterized protein n=1 Tax=Trichinella nelsoni TaxID=6336 RepID=A0A0V0SJ75_9BILA|nr:hypothetical protein T07_2125 [Trichinella nelsoni]